jgi:hypothetical protein
VQANDNNGGIATQTISVTVTPINDNAPVFTSPDAFSVLEGTTPVLTVTAADADRPPQTVTYSIAGGADQAKFNITPFGALSFNSPPDFEAPADSNGDNIYIVIVQASDGQFTNLQAILVTVTNAIDGPILGDYNNNGTVDLADYVLWRNGGPLQNDPTPGVQPDDYNIWRANFGRMVGQPSGELGAGSAAVIEGAPAVPQTLDSERPLMDAPLLRLQGVQLDRQKFHRPTGRSSFAEASLRDDALVAWLASRAVDPERRSFPRGVADSLERFRSDQYAEPSIAELDLAFALN